MSASSPQPEPGYSSGPRMGRRVPSLSPSVGVGIGVVTLVLGLLVLAWPSATLLVVAILFGIELVILGVIRIVGGVSLPAGTGWVRPLAIVVGVLTVVAGVICFVHPGASLVVLAIFLGIGWVIDGVVSLVQVFRSGQSAGGRILYLLAGLVSVLAGLVVVFFPGSSLLTLTRLAGILMIIVGLAQLISAFSVRRAAAAAA